MYTLIIEYKENGQVKTLTAEATECYAHVSTMGTNCNVVLANVTDHGVMENLAAQHVTISRVSLKNDEEKTVYFSEYWNCLNSVSHSFPANGEGRCDVNFTHCDNEAHNVA